MNRSSAFILTRAKSGFACLFACLFAGLNLLSLVFRSLVFRSLVFRSLVFSSLASLTLASLTLAAAQAADRVLIQSTTSTHNSGFYDYLAPLVRAELSIDLEVVSVGTGAALRNAMNCDGDILLVHAKDRELAFVSDGHGLARFDLMYNDFIIVGPRADKAAIAGLSDPAAALAKIAEAGLPFISRGDDSGTHIKELSIWQMAKIDPRPLSGSWYLETGSGMGASLNVAAAKNGYILVDRASWIAFANRQDLTLLVEGHPALFNQYGVIIVNPVKCPNVRLDAARRLQDWLLSPAGQTAIASFRKQGKQLFFANAGRGGQ